MSDFFLVVLIWFLNFQVMEKLVDIVHFLHLEIHEAFGSAGKHQLYFIYCSISLIIHSFNVYFHSLSAYNKHGLVLVFVFKSLMCADG